MNATIVGERGRELVMTGTGFPTSRPIAQPVPVVRHTPTPDITKAITEAVTAALAAMPTTGDTVNQHIYGSEPTATATEANRLRNRQLARPGRY